MNFKTAVWLDEETESWHARIYPEAVGIDLAAWGFTSTELEPIDIEAASIHDLGQLCEAKLQRISPDFPMSKFNPQFIGKLNRSADIRALLDIKLAAVAA